VIILDVLTDEVAPCYRAALSPRGCTIVQLLPTFDEVKRRFDQRGPVLTEEELRMVYAQQTSYTQYDHRIDNTAMPPEAVAAEIIGIWKPRQ
jgi:hypothetical protein